MAHRLWPSYSSNGFLPAEDPRIQEVVQSVKLHVSGGLQYTVESQRSVCSNASEGMDCKPEGEKAGRESRRPSSRPFI